MSEEDLMENEAVKMEAWRGEMRRKLWSDFVVDAIWIPDNPNPLSPLAPSDGPLDRAEKAILRFDKLFPAPAARQLTRRERETIEAQAGLMP